MWPTRFRTIGGAISGPILIPKIYNGKQRTFFFFNWEEFREFTLQSTTSQTVPIAAYRTGDFTRAMTGRTLCPSAACTAAFADPRGNAIREGQVFDPNSRANPNKVIPIHSCREWREAQ